MNSLRQLFLNKKSMTLIGGIFLLVSVVFLAVYMLPNILAGVEGNPDAGNMSVQIWNGTDPGRFFSTENNTNINLTINEGVSTIINFSVRVNNRTVNLTSMNVTFFGSVKGTVINLTGNASDTTYNGFNATGVATNVSLADGRFVLKWENGTAAAEALPSYLIKGGQMKNFWFTIKADRPGVYNMTVSFNITNSTGGADNLTGGGSGENIFDFGYNSTNITIVVNDTTAPQADVFIDLWGVDTNAHTILSNTSYWINSSKSFNVSCNYSDNYNATNVSVYIIPASYNFGIAGAPTRTNRTTITGFNITSLNITSNNTGVTGIDTSANYSNFSIVRNNGILTTGKYLVYCTVTDNASNMANSSMEPFELTAWDFGGSIQNSTYNNDSGNTSIGGVNVSLYEFVGLTTGPPTEIIIASANASSSFDGAFTLLNIKGNQSKPANAVPGTGNYSGQYKIKILKYNATYASTNNNVTDVGPTLPPMPKEALIYGMNNSVFYLQPAVVFRLCAFNTTNGVAGNRSFNYELTDEALGFPVSSSIPAPASCNTTIAVQQNRSYSISFMRNPLSEMGGAGDGANWGMSVSDLRNGSAAPPITIRFTNLTSYSQGAVINVIKNLSFTSQFVTFRVNYTGNVTPVAVNNVTVYLASRSGFITPNGGFRSMKVSPVSSSAGWNVSNFSIGNVAWESNDTSTYVSFPVIGADSPGIEYFVIVDGNETLGSLAWMGNFSVTSGSNITRNITLERLLGRWDANLTNRTEYMITLINSSGSALTSAQNVELKVKHSNFGVTRFVGLGINSSGSFTFPILKSATYAKVTVFNGDSAPVEWSIDLSQNASNVTVNSFRPELMDANGNRSNFTDVGGQGFTISFYKMSTACNVPYPDSTCKFSSGTATQGVMAFNPMQAMLAGKANVRVNISSGITMYFIGVDMLASGPPDMTMSQSATNTSTAADSVTNVFKFGSMAPDVMDSVWVGVPYNIVTTPDGSTFYFKIPGLYNRTWGKVWDYTVNTSAQLPDEYVDYNVSMLNAVGILCSKDNWTDMDCYVNTTDDKLWFRLPHFTGSAPAYTGYLAGTGTGSGGGGGGGGAGETPSKSSWSKITPGAASIAFVNAAGIKTISISVKNPANEVSITVTKQDGQPAIVEKTITGQVYKYMKIDNTNLSNDNIDKVTIKVMVEKSWIKNKSLTNSQISGYRWDETDKKWIELKTTFDSEDAIYAYFNAETNHLSYFAVGQSGGVPAEQVTPTNLCGNGNIDTGETCSSCSADVKCADDEQCISGTCQIPAPGTEEKNLTWLWWTIGVVIVLVIVLILVTRKRK